ncbi:MAG: 8-amino-7-oxononanoate synthase [Rhodobiaceae bacterium]|nr:8-amino-7-oxononanoate synthase [Rhodobiaceae bacterium]
MLEYFHQALAELAREERRRALAPMRGLDFASNDYLALASAPELKKAVEDALGRGVSIGAGASRLLRGNHPEHEALEEEAARYFGCEGALYLGNGFLANYSLMTTLPQRGDLIVHDALVHASAHDGMRTARAEAVGVPHNDVSAFADAIAAWRARGGAGRVWILVESLYSMDGDRAPLADLVALADRAQAMLLIDEAHATGVFGPGGRGLAAELEGRENVITLHTCGKALGTMGALICAPKVICDFLVNRCRPFIFSTAPSPLMAAATRAALRLLEHEPARQRQLAGLIEFSGRALAERTGHAPSGSQILPVIVGGNGRAMALAAAMQGHGYDIRGIRPPTVPDGTARLRIALTLHVNQDQVSQMIDVLAGELASLAA